MDIKFSPVNPGHPSSVYLLRLPEVMQRTGKCRSDIYRAVSLGTFPAPVKLGERASAWSSVEVDAWIQARIAARERAA